MSDNPIVRKIAMYRAQMRRALKIGLLMSGGGFLILGTLILKYSDAQDVFPQIRFVGILCTVIFLLCGFAAWDNFQAVKKLKKEYGHIEFAKQHKEVVRTARESLARRFKQKAFLCVLLAILSACIDSRAMPFMAWLVLAVSICLCFFVVIISMHKDWRRFDEMYYISLEPEDNGLK